MEIIHIRIVGIVAILSLIFGIRVYIANKTSVLNKAFSVFAFVIAIWLILDFLKTELLRPLTWSVFLRW